MEKCEKYMLQMFFCCYIGFCAVA